MLTRLHSERGGSCVSSAKEKQTCWQKCEPAITEEEEGEIVAVGEGPVLDEQEIGPEDDEEEARPCKKPRKHLGSMHVMVNLRASEGIRECMPKACEKNCIMIQEDD